MSELDLWTSLGRTQPSALSDAALELHWAAQVLAAAGQTFVEPREDDSHRAMAWHPGLGCFMGDPFARGYGFRVGLRPDDLALRLVDATDQVLGAQPLAGLTLDDAHDWLSNGLRNYMGNTVPFIQRPEYDMPEHPLHGGAAFHYGRQPERSTLQALYEGASLVLEGLREAREGASPVRCWPHHFDIATLITFESRSDDGSAKTVGVGMAPYGGGYEDWYWYVTPYPYPAGHLLEKLEAPGLWHTEGWTGAVLPGAKVVGLAPEHRRAAIERFIVDAVAKASRALGVAA